MSIEQKINYQLNKYPAVKKVIKRAYQTGMYAISKKIKSEGNITRISPDDPQHEYFFGYYDKSPWDISDRYMLCMKANDTWSDVSPREAADILLIDTSKPETDKGRIRKIAETRAWNVQQACMLQWLGPDFSSRILYNDYRDGKYVCVILTLETMEEKIIPAAVYSVSSDGKFALTLDFSRLYELRPGYGYYNVPEKTKGVALPDSTAIWKVNLETGEVTNLLKYTDFANFQPRPEMKEAGAVHKVNHIMLSPNGKRFMVLYRWFNGQRKYTRLITCNVDGTDMYVLSDDDMVSHCFWKNNSSILAFENKKKSGPGYYLMKDKTQNYIHCWPQFSNDGHPSYSPDGSLIVTDSYPDRARVASINLMDGNERKRENTTIARVFAPFRYDNDTRCDLHPRWNHAGNKICFDSVFEGHRGLYIVEINENLSGDKNKPKVSVAMCSYNGEKYIKEQLDTIINQSIVPDEIIIADDCSTDSTVKLLEEYAIKHSNIDFKIQQNKKNKGYTLNFLNAVKQADGDIIFLADQDDMWEPTKIEDMLDVFSKYSDALAVNCSYDLIDKNGNKIKNRFSVTQRKDNKVNKILWKEFVLSTRYPGMSMAISKKLLNQLDSLPDEMIPAHDWLLNEAAAYNNGMYYYGKILTHYRQHGDNSVGAVKTDSTKNLLDGRKHTIEFFEKTHKTIGYMHQNKKIQDWTVQLLKLDKKRLDNIYNKKILSCIFTFIINRKKMTTRCFMGDLYTILKLRKE